MKIWLLISGLILAGYCLTGIVQVLPGEIALVRRFGKILDDRPGPGLWIGYPRGIDQVERIPVDRLQTLQIGGAEESNSPTPVGQFLTGDHNLVNIQASLTYKVKPEEIIAYSTQKNRIPAILEMAAEATLGELVAGIRVDDVLLKGKLLMRQPLVSITQERLEKYKLGIEIVDAQIGQLTPPEEVKSAFDNVSRAQTTIATHVNRAAQEADSQQRGAESETYRTRLLSKGFAESKILLGQQEARNFERRLQEYQSGVKINPDYLRQIWEEERGKILSRLKENRQLGLLDHHLGIDGLDLSIIPSSPR